MHIRIKVQQLIQERKSKEEMLVLLRQKISISFLERLNRKVAQHAACGDGCCWILWGCLGGGGLRLLIYCTSLIICLWNDRFHHDSSKESNGQENM